MNSQILPKLCQRSWVCGPKDSFIHPNRLFLNIFCVPGIPLGTWHEPQHFPGSALAVDWNQMPGLHQSPVKADSGGAGESPP